MRLNKVDSVFDNRYKTAEVHDEAVNDSLYVSQEMMSSRDQNTAMAMMKKMDAYNNSSKAIIPNASYTSLLKPEYMKLNKYGSSGKQSILIQRNMS